MKSIARSLALALSIFITGCCARMPVESTPVLSPAPAPPPVPALAVPADGWQSLFDGKTLTNWTPTSFGGETEVAVVDGTIQIKMGYPMTGITWKGAAPMVNDYEIELDARRVDGNDFFCGLTVPIGDSFISLIMGGWGGTVTGISSINGFDASDNETGSAVDYKQNQWYHARMRVTQEHVQAWLDGTKIIDIEGKKKWSTRPEVDPSKPLGIATYETTAQIRNIRWRPIPTDSK